MEKLGFATQWIQNALFVGLGCILAFGTRAEGGYYYALEWGGRVVSIDFLNREVQYCEPCPAGLPDDDENPLGLYRRYSFLWVGISTAAAVGALYFVLVGGEQFGEWYRARPPEFAGRARPSIQGGR